MQVGSEGRTEVRMILRLTRGQTLLVIVPEQLIEEINRFVRDEALIVRGHEARPRAAGISLSYNDVRSEKSEHI